jgi:hypothetical protein
MADKVVTVVVAIAVTASALLIADVDTRHLAWFSPALGVILFVTARSAIRTMSRRLV